MDLIHILNWQHAPEKEAEGKRIYLGKKSYMTGTFKVVHRCFRCCPATLNPWSHLLSIALPGLFLLPLPVSFLHTQCKLPWLKDENAWDWHMHNILLNKSKVLQILPFTAFGCDCASKCSNRTWKGRKFS